MFNKKTIVLVAIAALVVCLGLAGCGGSQPASSSAASSSPASSATSSSAGSASASSAASYIGDQAAIDIALKDAGFAAGDVTGLKAELDLDDAVVHYDIEFKQGGIEYDYDIDATTGAIIKARSEIDD